MIFCCCLSSGSRTMPKRSTTKSGAKLQQCVAELCTNDAYSEAAPGRKAGHCFRCGGGSACQWVDPVSGATCSGGPHGGPRQANDSGSLCRIHSGHKTRRTPCECGRNERPSYGFKGERPVCCNQCAHAGMVHLRDKQCPTCQLKASATYGWSQDGKATHCCHCKENGMIYLTVPKCVKCGSVAHFGKDDGRRTHCSPCAKQENQQRHNEAYKNLTARWCSCRKRSYPTFGWPGGQRTHCQDCHVQGMVNFNLLSKQKRDQPAKRSKQGC